ncbi:hypothetical protein [Mesorhizobium sp.]|uniref:hypothetical protein n=1 Tax=Mesorhizobium sp. TaxID=1871066 RepID=UPI001212BFAC|nr:hypothetical protein [Mesorhizobium sp.]TIO72237.1 MAG: hypothetical protein E5X75_33365 [Mesorhizobium sp.]
MSRILNLAAIGAAASGVSDLLKLLGSPRNLIVQANFAYGAGGTSVDAYLQTSLDGGQTWIDIANFHFTTSAAVKVYNLYSGTPKTTAVTPTDGALTANTAVDGVLGALYRCKYVTVGTYTGATSLSIDVVTDQQP